MDFLIALWIIALMMPVVTLMFGMMKEALKRPKDLQDEIGIAHLRYIINCANETEVSVDSLSFLYQGRNQILKFSNGHLYLTSPGTQIFLTDLSEVSFETNDDCIYLSYIHTEESEERIVCLGHV